MESLSRWDVRLERDQLKGRAFLLGNKRAFSLCLPAAPRSSVTLLHPHKWFGAFLYGRKFLEGHVVRAIATHEHLLGSRQQTGFVGGVTQARREYLVEDLPCSEEYFVPDGVQGFACTLVGDLRFAVEPEFDLRIVGALNESTDMYEVEDLDHGVMVSSFIRPVLYDDATERFVAQEADATEGVRLWAAVEVVADNAVTEVVPQRRRDRRKLFLKDHRRLRFLSESAPEDARYDHAPLWDQSASRVYVPRRFHFERQGTVIYGFGGSREEALNNLTDLRDNLVAFEAQKSQSASEVLDRARFQTGVPQVDVAHVQVLTRLMDGLVARHAETGEAALDGPATMILAGNQYFYDSWKRDENIALGGLLSLGFYGLARDVIRDTWQLQDSATGRLPQRIRIGEIPAYHSSDGTLWALWRLHQYWRCTGDDGLLYELLPMVSLFFQRSLDRCVRGLLPSGRTAAHDYLWETWMDTPHTPRDGFPVEVEMLWIACLRVFRPLLQSAYPDVEVRMAAAEAEAWAELQRFNVRGIPADGLDQDGEVRDLITPNPYFCFGVGLDMGPQIERAMRDVGRRQLAGNQGIRTLAPQDWGRVFSPEFLGDRRAVRGRRMRSIGKFNYHRGVEWNWLAQFFVQAELKYGAPDIAYRKYVRPQVDSAMRRAGIGGISEIFDLSGTRGPEFQAWSMAGFLEALHAFAGVRIDVPNRRVSVEPQIPETWSGLEVRKWYGALPLDVRYERTAAGRRLEIELPWGALQADIEISLTVPARARVDSLDLLMEGVSVAVPWRLQRIPGSGALRCRFTIPAAGHAQVMLGLKRSPGREVLTA